MRHVARNTIIAAASLLMTAGIVGFSDEAFATTTGAAPSVSVGYDVKAASTTEGRRALDNQIRSAAARVCEPTTGRYDLASVQCRAEAITRAEASLDGQLMAVTSVEVASR